MIGPPLITSPGPMASGQEGQEAAIPEPPPSPSALSPTSGSQPRGLSPRRMWSAHTSLTCPLRHHTWPSPRPPGGAASVALRLGGGKLSSPSLGHLVPPTLFLLFGNLCQQCRWRPLCSQRRKCLHFRSLPFCELLITSTFPLWPFRHTFRP